MKPAAEFQVESCPVELLPELVTVDAAARYLGVSRESVRAYMRDGMLRFTSGKSEAVTGPRSIKMIDREELYDFALRRG